MDIATIEGLEVNPAKKLTEATKKTLIEIIENEFYVQSTLYDAEIKEKQDKIKSEYLKKVGFTRLKKTVEQKKHELRMAQKAIENLGLDENGNVEINEYRNKVGAESGRALQEALDGAEKAVRPAHNIKNKIIARMALADTHGEAFVILRQTLGNGVIPSLTQKQLEAPPAK